jgi:ribonuclease D
LLQLSTRDSDWVVDTLALRGQLGPALAPLFADPSVEKVLHGSDNDILWLQVGSSGGDAPKGGGGMQLQCHLEKGG